MTDHHYHRAERLLARLHAASIRPTRRQLLRSALSMAVGGIALSILPSMAGAAYIGPRFTSYPFSLGVASGYPRPDGISLWTRLAPEPLQEDGGMWPDFVDVQYEVAEDEAFTRTVSKGSVRAVPELAHSVHVDIRGLLPGRWYFYRFTSGNEVSPVGRTRTAEGPQQSVDRLRFAVGSCQHFEQAFFAAHRHLKAEDLDLMLFVGDYIYESNWGDNLVRRHVGPEADTLGRYRVRHAQYKTDRDLQAMHQSVPWAFTWDDHEVDNDYAGAVSEHLDPAFLARRAAAYQAFFEHMPMPMNLRPHGPDMRIFDTLDFGRFARFYLVDDRQYRDPAACPLPYKGAGSTDVSRKSCPEAFEPNRSLLGASQERWLDGAFATSKAQWNVLAQQTIFSRFGRQEGGELKVWTDGWDGYPGARDRVLDGLLRHKVRNPLILGGDIHAAVIADVHRDFDRERSAVVAAEFCSTSVASQGWVEEQFNERLPQNPHVKFGNTSKRGYIAFEATAQGCSARLRVLNDEKSRDSDITTLAAFEVENDRPGVVKV